MVNLENCLPLILDASKEILVVLSLDVASGLIQHSLLSSKMDNILTCFGLLQGRSQELETGGAK